MYLLLNAYEWPVNAQMHALQEGHDVLGGYMSPVNDAYGKKGLLSSQHRVRMCQLAADDSPSVMVDAWEAAQPQYQRSLAVLRHVSSRLQVIAPRIMLVVNDQPQW